MSDTKLIVTKDKLDKLATSISTKSGVATPMTIAQMKVAVDGISGGTITQDEDGYLVLDEGEAQGDGQLKYSMNDIFINESPVDSVSLPTVTQLKDSAFYGNTNITFVDAPNVTRIGEHVFQGCSSLKSVNMPSLKYCGKLFNDNHNLLDDESIINSTRCYAFTHCQSLENIYLPKVEKAGFGFFYQNNYTAATYKTKVVMPSVCMLGTQAFRQGKFVAVDLGANLNQLAYDTFYAATIDTLVLRSPMLVTADTRDAVRSITTLYVPSALVSEYATATNWTTDASSRTVLPIEGSIYETQYADGTPITGSIVDIDLSQCNWESNSAYSESSSIGTSYDNMTDNGSGNRIISGLIDVSDTSEICVIAKNGYQYGYLGFDENGNYLKKYLNWSSTPFIIDTANNEIKKIAIIVRLGNGSTAVAPGSLADTGITVRRQWM